MTSFARYGTRITATALALLLAGTALAGPPYVTDDPEPTDPGGWEIYSYFEGAHFHGETGGDTGFDINYGAAKDLQLTVVTPVDWADHEKAAVGNIELGVKYRFVHDDPKGITPDISFFPSLELPTGAHRMGGGQTSLFLPLWAQKDMGKWSLFGGAGYSINFGAGRKNVWLTGIALTRELDDANQIGAELYRETSDDPAERSTKGIGFGLTHAIAEHWSLLGSGGPQWTGHRHGANFYVALLFHR